MYFAWFAVPLKRFFPRYPGKVVNDFRSRMPIAKPNTIYLNNAATGFPKPPGVVRAVTDCLRSVPIHHARSGIDSEEVDVVSACRRRLATFFGVSEPERIIFTSGATESLNLAIFGSDLEGKHVVTTAVEHNSVLRPLKTLERDGRIALSIAPCDQSGTVLRENIEALLRPDTAIIVVNHCSNVTGAINDIARIGRLARERNIPFVVDAAQSAGVVPIDVERMHIDFLAFTGHKGLHGIRGIGGAYIGPSLRLRPLKVGGTGIRSDYLYQPEELPIYYEAGTLNIPGIVSLHAGVEFLEARGIDAIRAHKECCCERLRSRLQEPACVRFYPTDSTKSSTLLSFNIEGMEPADVGYILENSFGISVRSGLQCAPLIHQHLGTFPRGSIRVSPSFATTNEEIDACAEAVGEIVKAL